MSNDKKLDLTPKDFSFICPLNMDELTPIEGGYHCDSCEKKVYDVSHMSKSEFQTLQEKTKDLCISFKKVTTVAVVLSASGWVAADNNITSLTNIQTKQNSYLPYGVKGMIVPIKQHSPFPYGVKGKIKRRNTFKLEKVKVIPHDSNETNITNALTPPVKCDIETSIDGGDNVFIPYNEEKSN